MNLAVVASRPGPSFLPLSPCDLLASQAGGPIDLLKPLQLPLLAAYANLSDAG